MLARIILYFFGFVISSLGISYIILYSNLLTIGYNFNEYVHFIISRIECWYSIVGLVIVSLVIYIPRRKNK